MKKYSEHINYLKRKSTIPESRYFEFKDEKNELFNGLYRFYQANLERQHKHYKFEISPAYVYFIDSSDLNALASPPKDGIFLLGISRGLIELFDTKLNRYFDISDYAGIEGIQQIQDCVTNSIGELMYQTLTHFTFYHELGHLIEFSQSNRKEEIEEKLSGNYKDFNYEDHIKEADADLFASICVGTHLYQYFENYFECEWTEELITCYLSILSSSIFTYFLSFNEYHDGLYFEQKSHPHPLVRLFYSLEVIVDYFVKVLKKKNVNYDLDQQQIMIQTFKISQVMISKFFDDKKFQDFQQIIFENNTEILKYKNKLIDDVSSMATSAVNERNRKITKMECKIS
ncbi:MAG TPA: hypothetical protein PLZ32_14000 [Saprospiraceae bacterium]|nr:hypothetical protein [Saprospiraceae bacterium]